MRCLDGSQWSTVAPAACHGAPRVARSSNACAAFRRNDASALPSNAAARDRHTRASSTRNMYAVLRRYVCDTRSDSASGILNQAEPLLMRAKLWAAVRTHHHDDPVGREFLMLRHKGGLRPSRHRAPVPARESTPKAIAPAQDNAEAPVARSADMFLRWTSAKAAAELHIFERGGHGFAFRQHELPADGWPSNMRTWGTEAEAKLMRHATLAAA